MINVKMSEKCTCIDMLFKYPCSYCHNKLCKYIHERDNKILQIKEKNKKDNNCKCVYFLNIGLYYCESCDKEIQLWISQHRY